MPIRLCDYNLNGEQRLLYGKECLSSEPMFLELPSPNVPLYVLQHEELVRQQRRLAEMNMEESDADLLDFDDLPDEQDFADNYSFFEQAFQRFVDFKEQKNQKNQDVADKGVAEGTGFAAPAANPADAGNE